MADEPTTQTPQAESFYAGAYQRIVRFMMALGGMVAVFVLLRFGWLVAAGFVIGGAIALLNFYWLKRVVSALADKVTATGARQSSKSIVLRFLLRYFLIALGAYAIFSISPASVYGLLAGLFLPVGAIFCEAVYEMYAALCRGV